MRYLNAGGLEVNTAEPGGHIDTNEYDAFGNVARTLQASERALALALRWQRASCFVRGPDDVQVHQPVQEEGGAVARRLDLRLVDG
ncbi:hypothetical protein [Dactylosporangium sp. NPDC000521]|uniref:hypothetical protein n=1 Tax=Dactylosporangium sp. NPDC000521 TaxID=3363975 RepID=UPI0036BBB247